MEQKNFLEEIRNWRKSTLTRDHPIRGETSSRFPGRIIRMSTIHYIFKTHFQVAGEARNDFWSVSGDFIYRHQVEPRVKLCAPREEIIPYSHWNTLTSPGYHRTILRCDAGKPASMIIGTSMDQVDLWDFLGQYFTQFILLLEKYPDRYMWSWGTTNETAR